MRRTACRKTARPNASGERACHECKETHELLQWRKRRSRDNLGRLFRTRREGQRLARNRSMNGLRMRNVARRSGRDVVRIGRVGLNRHACTCSRRRAERAGTRVAKIPGMDTTTMRKRTHAGPFVLLAVLAAAGSAACKTSADTSPRTDPPYAGSPKVDDAEQVRRADADQAQLVNDQLLAELNDARSTYASIIQREIQSAEDEITMLRGAADSAKGKAKSQYDSALAELAARRDALLGDLSVLETATVADWEGVKAKVDNDLDDIDVHVRTATNQRKSATLRQRQ